MQDLQSLSPRSLIGRLIEAPANLGAGFLPALKAYGGFKHSGRVIPADETLGRLGTLEVRLARNAAEVRRAQRCAIACSTRKAPPSSMQRRGCPGATSTLSIRSAIIFWSSTT